MLMCSNRILARPAWLLSQVPGNDELHHYREVIGSVTSGATSMTAGSGLLVFEAPPDLASAVVSMMIEVGFTAVEKHVDCHGMFRCVAGVCPQKQ